MSKSEEGHVTHFCGEKIAGGGAGITFAEVPQDRLNKNMRIFPNEVLHLNIFLKIKYIFLVKKVK